MSGEATGRGNPAPDLREKAASPKGGEPQISERRLYLQLQVWTGCDEVEKLLPPLKESGLESVVYLDLGDPKGVGLLVMAEDPGVFAGPLRALLLKSPFSRLVHRPKFTMMGRTYATGREPNLEFALLAKPRATALNPDWPWAVWYPLRRKANFALLPPEDQGKILHEHALIGMAFGAADYAHDVRLACHGLDQDDNEFVIGLVGKDLTPLSQCVQEMRKTVQTAKYIKSLGPFFVGRVHWQSPVPAGSGARPRYTPDTRRPGLGSEELSHGHAPPRSFESERNSPPISQGPSPCGA